MEADVARLGSIATAGGDRSARAGQAAEWIRAGGGYHWVGVYDVTPTHIQAIAWTGATPPAHPKFPRSHGLNGAAVATGAPVVVQDVRQDPRYLTTFGATLAEAIFPIRSTEGEVVGTLDVESDRAHAFSPDDELFLRRCAEALRPIFPA
jgi:L-methionine (R)-S-oxide reductase